MNEQQEKKQFAEFKVEFDSISKMTTGKSEAVKVFFTKAIQNKVYDILPYLASEKVADGPTVGGIAKQGAVDKFMLDGLLKELKQNPNLVKNLKHFAEDLPEDQASRGEKDREEARDVGTLARTISRIVGKDKLLAENEKGKNPFLNAILDFAESKKVSDVDRISDALKPVESPTSPSASAAAQQTNAQHQ